MSTSHDPSVRPSLRDENRERTRQRVLDAVVELALLRGGLVDPEVFTYAWVAEIAGVSERTVYRLFPTKRDLARAYIESRSLEFGQAPPEDVDEFAPFMRDLAKEWSTRFPGQVQMPMPASLTPEENPEVYEDRRQRDDLLARKLDEVIPMHLPERQRLAMVAAIHSATSMHTLIYAAGRWGLTLAEAVEAHAWAFEVFLDALRTKEIEPWQIPNQSEAPA